MLKLIFHDSLLRIGKINDLINLFVIYFIIYSGLTLLVEHFPMWNTILSFLDKFQAYQVKLQQEFEN